MCNKSNEDDQDYERINQLIARYSNIGATQDDAKSANSYHISSFRQKKKFAGSVNASGRSIRTEHTYPMKNDNYFYNIPSLSDSNDGKGKNYHPIQITCHDLNDVSSSNDTDSSISTASIRRSKEDIIASKSKQVKFQDHNKHVDQQTSFPTFSCNKSYSEKTTYCRPIRTPYERNFLCKIMERNAKLQLLLTKYVIIRHKEKEKEKCNNYVNMIKMKNRWFRESSKYLSSRYESRKNAEALLINDCNTNFNLQQSDSCREMLHDLYHASDEQFEHPDGYHGRMPYSDSSLKNVYYSRQPYFPKTLRAKRNDKHRGKPERTWSTHRRFYSRNPKIVIEAEDISTKASKNDQYLKPSPAEWFTSAKVYPRRANIFDNMQSRNAQTNITFGDYGSKLVYSGNKSEPEVQHKSIQHLAPDDNLIRAVGVMNEVENFVKSNEKHDVTAGNIYVSNEGSEVTKPKITVDNLESKIDKLINLFNSFIKGMESKRKLKESNETFVIMTDYEKDQNSAIIDSQEEANTEKRVTVVGNVMTNTSFSALESHLTPSHYLLNMRLNKILHEELDKSNKLRSEIEALLNPTAVQPYAVKLSVDIPTRERSTEVTDSLLKTRLKKAISEEMTVEDISHTRPMSRRISHIRPEQRIAVNTEPLGLLTLLRLSAEAVRQVLSFVPNLGWYLTNLQHPVPSSHDYVCNICGAAFAHPSQLGAHILTHDLGQARDCSVCRHSVDSRRSSQLFCCPYCGQRFTRAYCCELHQQGCSRRVRNRHSSFTILR